MKKLVLIAACAVLASGADAQERRRVDPLAIASVWLGNPGAVPEVCSQDGFRVGFGTTDGKSFLMTVERQVGGTIVPGITQTEYEVMPAPAGAPTDIDIFLTNPKGDLGVRVKTGSEISLIPAGPEKNYPAVSLILKRCG